MGQPFSYLFTKIRETLLGLPIRYPFLNYGAPYWLFTKLWGTLLAIYKIMGHLIGKEFTYKQMYLFGTPCQLPVYLLFDLQGISKGIFCWRGNEKLGRTGEKLK